MVMKTVICFLAKLLSNSAFGGIALDLPPPYIYI